jgi:hypothetical protein
MLAICPRIGENYTTVVLDRERLMPLGLAERQGNLLDDVVRFCDEALDERSRLGAIERLHLVGRGRGAWLPFRQLVSPSPPAEPVTWNFT